MSGKPKIYLCGPCDRLPDLGVGWRRDAAVAVTEAGGIPIWPPAIKSLADGIHDIADARAAWAANRRGEIAADLRALLDCDAVLVYRHPAAGLGTEAEEAVARWMGASITSAGAVADFAVAAGLAVRLVNDWRATTC